MEIDHPVGGEVEWVWEKRLKRESLCIWRAICRNTPK